MRFVLLFIEKQVSPNTLAKMNKKTIFSCLIVLRYMIQQWLYQKHILTENERNIVFCPFAIEIGDFVFQDKSKKRFLKYKSQPFYIDCNNKDTFFV